ncbi:MAG TPA: FAD:protein FMN transferase [Azospirillum sp.]|nr:FAD:protein FMN transferase [Azospirillum sp.]
MICSRRRFLTIAAATLAGWPRAPRAAPDDAVRWSGTVMGMDGRLVLQSEDRARAARAVGACLVEIARLERVFSLFRADSALTRLNRDGMLVGPPAELVEVLAEAQRMTALSSGAFDVTIQPLWDLYARHFAKPGADAAGPDDAAIAAALARIGMEGVAFSDQGIAFLNPGMAVTLNGIAQGYITDRIAALLRAEGFRHVLIDMGELRTLGPRADGAPWRVAVDGPGDPLTLDVADVAVATSSGAGTVFDPAGRHHHIFNPATGRSSQQARRVTVVARNATTADALSTALTVLPAEQARRCFEASDALEAYLVPPDGPMIAFAATPRQGSGWLDPA